MNNSKGKETNEIKGVGVSKRFFLIAPPHMDLYKDIVGDLGNRGFSVEFLAVKVFPHDPFFISNRYSWLYNKKRFLRKLELYWDGLYKSGKYSFEYDYLFVINGTVVHPKLFYYLKKHNPSIECINYLFDSTQNVYHFDRNFKYFDRIYTFDRKDAEKFGINFLPIYWTKDNITTDKTIKMFGFGVFNRTRYNIYSSIINRSKEIDSNSYIKLYTPEICNIKWFKFKNRIKRLFHLPIDITYEEYSSSLITHKTLSPQEFRNYIYNSSIVVDTSNSKQDGLTARFMWALGAGKKIITNNTSILEYPFYSKDQFFLIGDDFSELKSFINTPFIPSPEYKHLVEQWRLDKWLSTLFNLAKIN